MKFPHNSFRKRLNTMLRVDLRRMFTTSLFYILIGACLVAPVLILVMTTMMDGTESVNPQTGEVTIVEGFDNAWQILGSVSSSGEETADAMAMDMTAMCNINLLYFAAAVPVCLFVAGDFRSGYAKNLFAVRAKKTDYVVSKTLVCFLVCALMVLAFFLGTVLGGKIAGLPFTMEGFHTANLVMCLVAKMLLMGVFVGLYLLWSVVGRQRLWLSLVGSMMTAMFLFMMIPMLTPLDAGVVQVAGCLLGSVLFAIGFGAVSNVVLKKQDLL